MKIAHRKMTRNIVHNKIVCAFNPFPNKPWFLRVCSTSLLKTMWEKEKLCVTCKAISPFPTVFSTNMENFLPFHQTQYCRLQTLSVWKSLKFVIWEKG